MATHSRILAWKIPWTEEPDGPQLIGFYESDMTEQLIPCTSYETAVLVWEENENSWSSLSWDLTLLENLWNQASQPAHISLWHSMLLGRQASQPTVGCRARRPDHLDRASPPMSSHACYSRTPWEHHHFLCVTRCEKCREAYGSGYPGTPLWLPLYTTRLLFLVSILT